MKTLTHAVVLDDHQLFADSFALLLRRECAVDVVQPFNIVEEFFGFLRGFGKQELFVFLDYYFPDENGLALLSDIRRINPKAKVIFVTSATAPTVIRNILHYHPDGMLSKSCNTGTVITCFDRIRQGKSFIAPEFERMMVTAGAQKEVIFTPREIELLKYFSKGYSIAETAVETFLSPHTVVAHRRKMMAKANCQTIGQMLTYAKDNHLI